MEYVKYLKEGVIATITLQAPHVKNALIQQLKEKLFQAIQMIEMILTGDVISSEKAERIGLISQVVPYESLWESMLNLAKKIITKGPLARQLVMQVIHEGHDVPMTTALMLEKFAQTILLETKDKEEGLQAFLEKRTSEFYGI